MSKKQKKPKPLTPEEFEAQIKKEIETNTDSESCHAALDEMCCELLESLGYDAAMQLYRDAEKWYA